MSSNYWVGFWTGKLVSQRVLLQVYPPFLFPDNICRPFLLERRSKAAENGCNECSKSLLRTPLLQIPVTKVTWNIFTAKQKQCKESESACTSSLPPSTVTAAVTFPCEQDRKRCYDQRGAQDMWAFQFQDVNKSTKMLFKKKQRSWYYALPLFCSIKSKKNKGPETKERLTFIFMKAKCKPLVLNPPMF